MHISDAEIKKIEELITYKMNHTYLNKYIQKPVIDRAKLTALYMIVNYTALSQETKKQYMIATMLVQAALDTHDLVPVTNEGIDDETAITSKQLTVLAGDYYSGLYYLLLAEIDDIQMISILASAIKEITEYKMKLYYGKMSSFDEYLSITEKVETLLITRVADFLNHSITNNFTSKLIITNKLIEESKSFASKRQAPVIDSWLTLSKESYSSILKIVEEIIQANARQIETFLSQPTLQISVFKSHFQYMLHEFIYNNISVAEEG